MSKKGKVLLLMCSNSSLVTMSSADKNAMNKHTNHFNEAKYLGWKLFDNPAEAQVWICLACLEVIDLTTTDNPTVTTLNNKPASSDTKVGQSINVGGNDISGDCNLHAKQLQVYNHGMNTKDEAQKRQMMISLRK